jgi:uncharacterized integral membrane protein (TIGR00698 family)
MSKAPPTDERVVLAAIREHRWGVQSLSQRSLVGLLACVGLAIAARALAGVFGLGIETALALVLGLAVGTVGGARAFLLAGAGVAGRQLLRIGVALLGARLTLGAVVEGGAAAIIGATIVVILGLVLGITLARQLALPWRLGWLMGVGVAICGNSAILVLSPIVGADERETTYAVSTITLFGLVAVLTLPLLGHALGQTDGVFGTWAGLSVNDTAQVVATGYAYSEPGGNVATVVKLTRNLAIAPVIIGAAFLLRRDRPSTRGAVVRALPWFVVGFVALAGARTVGMLDIALPWNTSLADTLSDMATWLILIALAGVGLSANLRETLEIGPRPLALGIVIWIAILVIGLALAVALGGSVYDGMT